MRDWIGKEIARYEHAARRVQTFLWAVIAINTFVSIVWSTLPLLIVLSIYVMGGFGLLLIGYVSHKAKVGQAIVKTQFDIESKELWWSQNNLGYALLSMYLRMTDEELERALDHWSKKLNLDWQEVMKVIQRTVNDT